VSEKLPILSGKELIKILAKVGFVPTRQSRRSHIFLRHPDGRTTVVPLHDEISKRLLSGILAEIKISGEEFISLHKAKSSQR
jgi:predicted RNA binding protein YcfA (HicA-like mRNA interferase family)